MHSDLIVVLSGYDDRETRDMLIQIGLEDIVDFPSREQIAFLLVERARLLDELAETHELYEKTAQGHSVSRVDGQWSSPLLTDYCHFTF